MEESSSNSLTAILNAMEDGIYISSQDYTVEFMNTALIKKVGEGIGKKCYEVINHQDEVCSWCRAEDIFKRGQTLHWELHIPRINKTYNLTEMPVRNFDGRLVKLSILNDITGRKEQEKKLKASEADFKRLFEHVGCGVFISSKGGKFLNANHALLDMLGYDSKEDFLQIDITKDLYVRPENRITFQNLIERDGRVVDYEVEFKRKDGSIIPVLLTGHALYDPEGNIIGYEGINVDRSQRKQIEKELREAHHFLHNIIQSSPNAVMAADLKGNIILWNRGAENILGYRSEDVIGKMNITEVYPPGIARQVMKMLRSSAYGEPGDLRSFPIHYIRKDGEIVEGNISAAIIYDEEGKEMATVGIIVDLRERLEMERTLYRTQEQLLQSEKLAAMGRLTSQIAHELNNPLYGIMNTLELMKTEIPPDNRRRKLLDMSLSETMRLAEMLRKMLSFSKPDQEERSPVSINTLIEEILLLYEKQLFENTIKLSKLLVKDPALICASKNQLRQVFLNMISNAMDAMPEGGTLTIKTEANREQIKVLFSDTGIGIKKENLNKIFDAFYTTKGSVKGVGLGLSVCYGFIKDHGGDIKVESELGSGTTFTILLPAYKEKIP